MKYLPSCFGINGAIICIATLFLADSVDLAEYLGLFLLSILTLFSKWLGNFKNQTGAHRWARGAPLRPPFVASLLSPASAPPLGPIGVPPLVF